MGLKIERKKGGMAMTDTALKSAFFGVNAANPALKSVENAQKTMQPVSGKTQDFGAVLDKTAQKYEQKTEQPKQTAADTSTQSKTQQPEQTTAEAQNEVAEDTESVAENEAVETTSDREGTVEETSEKLVQEQTNTDEPVDEMTADEIAKALEQIITQLKEILGITDEELLSGIETLKLQTYDLLHVDNMAQLVTAISGEDSVISLVANEDLYTALQDITEMIGTQVNDLLDKAGLTGEELDAILQKLQELQSRNIEEGPLQDVMIIPEEESAATEPTELSGMTEPGEEQASVEPVIIKEDNTKSNDQPAKQYDQLPENQQENPADIGAKPQTQNTEKDSKQSDSKDSKDFSQNHITQDFQNNLNEVSDVAAAEGIEKFTSESTENIMRQLADMVKIVKNENLTEMELQLHPASLGNVNVSLTTKGGVVTAEFTTQNETVKAAIEAQASQLRANLEEQGVKIEAIEVSVESHQMERELDKDNGQQQRQPQEQETGRIQGMRRGRSSINLRAFTNGEELEGEMQGADDATRIAMEIMAANGNSMDLLA